PPRAILHPLTGWEVSDGYPARPPHRAVTRPVRCGQAPGRPSRRALGGVARRLHARLRQRDPDPRLRRSGPAREPSRLLPRRRRRVRGDLRPHQGGGDRVPQPPARRGRHADQHAPRREECLLAGRGRPPLGGPHRQLRQGRFAVADRGRLASLCVLLGRERRSTSRAYVSRRWLLRLLVWLSTCRSIARGDRGKAKAANSTRSRLYCERVAMRKEACMKRTLAVTVLSLMVLVPLLWTADAWARVGGGSSGGSRGSRSYSAPARPSSPSPTSP